MSHREAMGAVAFTLAVLLLACFVAGVLFFAGWGLIALYLLIVPAAWLAPLSIALAVVAGIGVLAIGLYLAYRDIPLVLGILGGVIVLTSLLLSWLPIPKGIQAFFKE